MRPSLPRLVRVVPRSTFTAPERGLPSPKIYGELPREVRKPPTLIEALLKQKEAAGASYPSNIRIEPVVSKKTFSGVKRELVPSVKAILKEQ
ncbi:hypothetical protein BC834DRAFT_815884 [Gloeopeniophorella convolvens]|nr:hypothetical protein BC834DRAFT_815884 [Gloeopeniophorella convolvens]